MSQYVVLRVNSAKQFWMIGVYNSEKQYDSAIVKDSKLSGYVRNYTYDCILGDDKEKKIKRIYNQITENKPFADFLSHSFGFWGNYHLVGYYEVWGYEKPNYSYYLVLRIVKQP